MFFSLLHQPLTQFVSILQVCLKMLVTILALVLLREEVEVVARVVVELVGVADIKGLGVAEDVGHDLRVLLQDWGIANHLHVVLGAVHGEDHRCGDHLVAQGDVLAILVQIGADREAEAFHERAHLARRIAVIDRRAKHDDICLAAAFQHGTKVVLQGTYTIRLRILYLTGKATLTSLEVNVVEVHQFTLGTSLLSTSHGTLQDLSCVPLLSRTAVHEDGLNLFCFQR